MGWGFELIWDSHVLLFQAPEWEWNWTCSDEAHGTPLVVHSESKYEDPTTSYFGPRFLKTWSY